MTLTLIDFGAVYGTAWESQHADEGPGAAQIRAVGIVRIILQRLDLRAPDVVLCGDSPRNWRHDLHSAYKANREAKPPGYLEQLRAAWAELTRELRGVMVSGFEADDVIATLAGDRSDVQIVTHDKDLLQLVDDARRVRVVSLRDLLGGTVREYDEAGVRAKLGVPPALVGDYLALVGDKSDNVPGVPGIGPKHAAARLAAHGSLDAVLEHAATSGEESAVARALREHAETARLSRRLVELRRDVPIHAAQVLSGPIKLTPELAEHMAAIGRRLRDPKEEEPNMERQQPTNHRGRFGGARVATGIPRAANKSIITGRPGIGKTRFLSTIAGVFLLDLEDGLRGASPDHQFGAFRDEHDRPLVPRTYDELVEALDAFDALNKPVDGRRPYQHLAIDGLTGIETLVHQQVCRRERVEHMEAKEWKQLWRAAEPLMTGLQRRLDAIREGGVHLWIAAHASEVYDSVSTTGETYRKWDLLMKGSGEVGVHARNIWRQWANNVWFLDWSTSLKRVAKGARTIARQDARVLHTAETGTHYAKSRDRLPATLPADWEDVARAMAAAASNNDGGDLARLREQIAEVAERVADADMRARILEASAGAATVSRLSAILSRAQGHVALAAPSETETDEGAAA